MTGDFWLALGVGVAIGIGIGLKKLDPDSDADTDPEGYSVLPYRSHRSHGLGYRKKVGCSPISAQIGERPLCF